MEKKELNDLDIELHGQVEVFYLNSNKYNGIVYEEFKGVIASEFEVFDGVKNGVEKIFFPNSIIESYSIYKNGLLHGVTKNYLETGQIQEEAYFEYGICVWSKIYDENGNLTKMLTIDKNGLEYTILNNLKKQDKTNS